MEIQYAKYVSDVLVPVQSSVLSGVGSDAILYLGPPDTFTRSPIEDSIYFDPDYFPARAMLYAPW